MHENLILNNDYFQSLTSVCNLMLNKCIKKGLNLYYTWVNYSWKFVLNSFWILNQAHAGKKPVSAWFLKIVLFTKSVCMCVRVCVCVCFTASEASGIIWNPYDWLNTLYSFYIAAIFSIHSRHGLRIEAYQRNQPNKSKLALHKRLLLF